MYFRRHHSEGPPPVPVWTCWSRDAQVLGEMLGVTYLGGRHLLGDQSPPYGFLGMPLSWTGSWIAQWPDAVNGDIHQYGSQGAIFLHLIFQSIYKVTTTCLSQKLHSSNKEYVN